MIKNALGVDEEAATLEYPNPNPNPNQKPNPSPNPNPDPDPNPNQAATLEYNVPMWKYVLAGGGSGCCSTCVLTPVELVKCRLQAQIGAPAPAAGAPPLFTGPIDVITRTVRAEGVAGLFRGNLSTLAREVPGNMAWF